jgi:hypothetical protein
MDKMDILDASIGLFLARANLIGLTCHLNHNGEEPPEAIDYLCQRLGDINDQPEEIATLDDPMLAQIPEFMHNIEDTQDMLRIPVCAECVTALYDEDWLLFYCLSCDSSQWLMKSKARKLYPKWESIRFLSGCPNCSECPDCK